MDEIRKNVQEHIYSLMTQPGVTLSEREIAQKFDLKRGNVREILLGMEGEGILERLPQRGYRHINYQDTDMQAIWTVRYAVEHEAVRRAIEAADREDMVRLALLIEEMEKHIQDHDYNKFAKADMEFHTALVAASRDNFLIRVFAFMSSTVFRLNRNDDIRAAEAMKSHREIYEHFKNRDWPKTEEALRAHLGRGVSL